jgi:molecular chaperone DnaK
LNVSAKDNGDRQGADDHHQGVRAASSEDEIERMVRDAEAHAEEDKRFRELRRDTQQGRCHAALGSKRRCKISATKCRPGSVKVESALADREGRHGQRRDKSSSRNRGAVASLVETSRSRRTRKRRVPKLRAGGAAGEGEASERDDTVLDAEFEEVER